MSNSIPTLRLFRINFSWLVRELVIVDNSSDREGGFSFPDGVARDCLMSVKHTKYTGKALSRFKSYDIYAVMKILTELTNPSHIFHENYKSSSSDNQTSRCCRDHYRKYSRCINNLSYNYNSLSVGTVLHAA